MAGDKPIAEHSSLVKWNIVLRTRISTFPFHFYRKTPSTRTPHFNIYSIGINEIDKESMGQYP